MPTHPERAGRAEEGVTATASAAKDEHKDDVEEGVGKGQGRLEWGGKGRLEGERKGCEPVASLASVVSLAPEPII